MSKRIVFVCIVFLAASLSAGSMDAPEKSNFRKYWYQQKAELTRYSLDQARYGEMRKGESVLIFVTEPFFKDKQVKYEFGDKANSISVLKLNFTRKFSTGIYPYSIMTSVFTPVDFEKVRTLKVTSSSQEWCGHTFLQLNFRNDKYHTEIRSYFQNEGDQDFDLKSAWLEDEVWTRIRLSPLTLPTGNIEMIPGLQYARLMHVPLKPEKAVAKMQAITDKSLSEKPLNAYSIQYQNISRKVVIRFEKEFPFKIVAWEETQPGGFGDKKLLTTRAVRAKTILLDYWNKNSVADDHYRKELGLTQE